MAIGLTLRCSWTCFARPLTLVTFQFFFHYVNVGPHIKDHEMITDVYLPIALPKDGLK